GIKDAKGNLYSINYNSDKVSKVVYPNGENYNINYTNTITTSTTKKNESGNSIYTETTNFDSTTGKITKETDVDGNETVYTYGLTSNPYLVTATSRIVNYQELNENKEMVNKNVEVTTETEYNENEDVEVEKDEEGNYTIYDYESEYEINKSQPTSIVTKESINSSDEDAISNEKFLYDRLGNLEEENNIIDNTKTINKYDKENGNLIESNEYKSTSNSEEISKTVNTYTYDELGNLEKETTSVENTNINSEELNEYDSMGRVTMSKDINGNSYTEYKYDFLGREINATTRTKIYNNLQSKKVKISEYDANGSLIKESEDGVTTEYKYDTINRLTEKAITNNQGTIVYNTDYSYEVVDNLKIKINSTPIDLENAYCEKNYKTINSNRILTDLKYYDKAGNVVREKSNGTYKDYIYDDNKNVIATFEMGSNNDGTMDSSNKKISLSLHDENGNNTCTVENASISNNLLKVTSDSIINKSTYDKYGNVIESTDAMGVKTGYTYDEQSRVTSVISDKDKPLENTTSIAYDVVNNDNTISTSITDAKGNKRYETQNAAGLTVKNTDKGDSTLADITTSYLYDNKGNKTKEIFSNGDYKSYDYTDDNQVKAIIYYSKEDNEAGRKTLETDYTYKGGTGDLYSMIDYKYDGNDKIPYHYTYYEYDSNKKLTGYSELSTNSTPSSGEIESHKLTYVYDVEGNIIEIIYPTSLNDSISSIQFEYNNNGWISKVYANINGTSKDLREYSYDKYGKIDTIKDFTYDVNANVNGHILKKYTYDDLNRVKSMKYYDSKDLNTVKESYTYTYDKNSNIKSESIINNYPTNDSDKVDEKRLYEYDNLARLTKSDIVNNKNNQTSYYNYTYDEVGNVISKAEILSDTEKNATVYTYNALNQLKTSKTTDAVNNKLTSDKIYTYDQNGNNTKEVDSSKNVTKEMTYDVDNRLDTYTLTENDKTTTQSNLYNGNGQRIQKTEGDNTINYYYQNGNVLYTTDKDEKKTSHNFVGLEGNTISTMRYDLTGLEYYVYNKDIKGSTTNIVDNNKNAKISYKYSDFGETKEYGDADFYNEIAYTGGIYDNLSSLYYLNARYYNPEDARFITQDTYRGEHSEPSSLHLYDYCTNNPINYVDPTGHSPVSSLTVNDYKYLHDEVKRQYAIQLMRTGHRIATERYIRKYCKKNKRGFLDIYDITAHTFYEIKTAKTYKYNYNSVMKQIDSYRKGEVGIKRKHTIYGKWTGFKKYPRFGERKYSGHFSYGIYDINYKYKRKGVVLYEPRLNRIRAAIIYGLTAVAISTIAIELGPALLISI
ncbi:RHS repeat-associated core domain-containing protein, partial [Intestinibacter bartlettii]